MASSTPTIDVHAHAMFPEIEELASQNEAWRRDFEARQRMTNAQSAEHNRKLAATVYGPRFASLQSRLAVMDAAGIDAQVVSTAPTHNFWYWAPPELAEQIVEINNQKIAELCAKQPQRLFGLGIVALQHPELAPLQLERALTHHGLRGAIVAASVAGRELADAELEPFWSTAERLGALIFIHPAGCAIEARLTNYYLSNVIGNPLETTMALTHLIFSRTLDRHPGLKIVAAHGGGYFPFYTARFDHGWKVRPEAHSCQLPPSHYLDRLWFDSLVYQPEQLGFLIKKAGASQIVLGTDYPFDMGDEKPLDCLGQVKGISAKERRAIAGENAARLIKLT